MHSLRVLVTVVAKKCLQRKKEASAQLMASGYLANWGRAQADGGVSYAKYM
jgi:hypothetical protein